MLGRDNIVVNPTKRPFWWKFISTETQRTQRKMRRRNWLNPGRGVTQFCVCLVPALQLPLILFCVLCVSHRVAVVLFSFVFPPRLALRCGWLFVILFTRVSLVGFWLFLLSVHGWVVHLCFSLLRVTFLCWSMVVLFSLFTSHVFLLLFILSGCYVSSFRP